MTARPFIGALMLLALNLLGCAENGDDRSAVTPVPSATLTPTATATVTDTPTAIPASPTPTRTATALPMEVSLTFDFRDGAQGWAAGFADYPAGEEEMFEFDAGVRALPPELGLGSGYFIQTHNRSDDVFMFLERRLGPADGLRPLTGYRVSYRIVFASNAQSDCAGIGGAPGESVYLKAGASDREPLAAAQGDGDVRMTVDKGNQSSGGVAATVVGHIANGIPCGSAESVYVSLERTHTHAVTVPAGSDATLWLLLGTDSGFEGVTALFFQRVEITLLPQ